MTFLQLSFLCVFLIFSCSARKEKTKLLLVQTIFRHGNRAPVLLYPNDPNSQDSWPNGLGRLTQLGKKQHYQVGKDLRYMYKHFVTSDPNEIYVNSSAEDRCLNSAESNLASFYAPTWKWKIAPLLPWQPIPIHYQSAEKDIYFNIEASCPRSAVALSNALQSDIIQEFYETHQTMVEEVTKRSGLNYSDPMNALYLYDTLEAEKQHNLKIPEWAKKYWDELSEFTTDFFQSFATSPELLKLRSGPFLGLLTENLKNRINGKTPNLKFIHNSSHDVNVALVLQALNFTGMPRPPYCATVLFELHEMSDSSMTVRLLYMNSTHPLTGRNKPHVLVLDGCSEFCPVEQFMESYQHLIPNNWSEECQDDS